MSASSPRPTGLPPRPKPSSNHTGVVMPLSPHLSEVPSMTSPSSEASLTSPTDPPAQLPSTGPDDPRESVKEKKPKKDKSQKKSKDKKSKRSKSSKQQSSGESSSDEEEFVVEDEANLLNTLRQSEGSVASPDQRESGRIRLQRYASSIQAVHAIQSLLPGHSGAGPVPGTYVKVLNQAAGFMFLSAVAGLPGTPTTINLSSPQPSFVQTENSEPLPILPHSVVAQRPPSANFLRDSMHAAFTKPHAALITPAATGLHDDPDTQRFLVQSQEVVGLPGRFLAFAAKSPVEPVLFLGAQLSPNNGFSSPFSPGRASAVPGSPNASQLARDQPPEVFFSSPFDPQVHCWKIIPTEGGYFFLQPALAPGFAVEAVAPKGSIHSAKGIARANWTLQLSHFRGASTQCFRTTANRGLGQSSHDTESVSRPDDNTTPENESSLSEGYAGNEALANAMRGLLRTSHSEQQDGLSLNSTVNSEHLRRDDAIIRIQCFARRCAALALRDGRRQARDAALDGQRTEELRHLHLALSGDVCLVSIQALLRQRESQLIAQTRRAQRLSTSAHVIARCLRGLGARRHVAHMSCCVATLLRVARGAVARVTLHRWYESMQRGRRLLWNVWEGYRVRRRLHIVSLRRSDSAARVVWRVLQGHLARHRLGLRRHTRIRSAALIQTQLRALTSGLKCAKYRRIADDAAYAAQQRRRDAACVIQRLARRSRALAEYRRRIAKRDALEATRTSQEHIAWRSHKSAESDAAQLLQVLARARIALVRREELRMTHRDGAARVLQTRLVPLATARTARQQRLAAHQAAEAARLAGEAADYAAWQQAMEVSNRLLQRLGRGYQTRCLLAARRVSSSVLQAVLQGYVARLCCGLTVKWRRGNLERRAAALRLINGPLSKMDAEGGRALLRLVKARPSTAPRTPSEWSVEAKKVALPTLATDSSDLLPHGPPMVVDTSSGLPPAHSSFRIAASTPRAAPTPTYPFRVPSATPRPPTRPRSGTSRATLAQVQPPPPNRSPSPVSWLPSARGRQHSISAPSAPAPTPVTAPGDSLLFDEAETSTLGFLPELAQPSGIPMAAINAATTYRPVETPVSAVRDLAAEHCRALLRHRGARSMESEVLASVLDVSAAGTPSMSPAMSPRHSLTSANPVMPSAAQQHQSNSSQQGQSPILFSTSHPPAPLQQEQHTSQAQLLAPLHGKKFARATAGITTYHLLKYKSLRTASTLTTTVTVMPATARVALTHRQSNAGLPPRPPSAGAQKVQQGSPRQPGRVKAAPETVARFSALPSAVPDFEASTESEAAVALLPPVTERPLVLGRISNHRALVERRLASQQHYRCHYQYLTKLLTDHRLMLDGFSRAITATRLPVL